MLRAVIGKPGHGKTTYLLYQMLQFVLDDWMVATNMSLTDRCPFAHRVMRLDDGKWPVFQLPEKAIMGAPCRMCRGRGTTIRRSDPSPHAHFEKITCPKCQGTGKWDQPAILYDAFWHYMPWKVAYILDELDNQFDSMDFQKLAEVARDARLYFKQHRKRQDIILYAVQNLDNIWTRIRRMTETFVCCAWNYRSNPLFRHLPITWSSFCRDEFSDPSFSENSLVSSGRFWYREAFELFQWYDTSQLVGDPAIYGWAGPDGDVERFQQELFHAYA